MGLDAAKSFYKHVKAYSSREKPLRLLNFENCFCIQDARAKRSAGSRTSPHPVQRYLVEAILAHPMENRSRYPYPKEIPPPNPR